MNMKNEILAEYSVLDHGFLQVVDTMGDDHAIAQAARCSYGAGTKTINDDRGLIRRLMRDFHSSPFEMAEIKLQLKMPLFVARQWIRHRTASVNEYSGRYSVMPDEMYMPELHRMTGQHKTNNQGSDSEPVENIMDCYRGIITANAFVKEKYGDLIAEGLNRETARTVLNLNQYTILVWKIDLHNLLQFLQLRMDSHAQWEIQQYANVIADYVKQWCPLTYEAFEDYRLRGARFSRMEMEMIRSGNYTKRDDMTKNEYEDFKQKMGIE